MLREIDVQSLIINFQLPRGCELFFYCTRCFVEPPSFSKVSREYFRKDINADCIELEFRLLAEEKSYDLILAITIICDTI